MNRFKPNKLFYYYLQWIVERQNIFWMRHEDMAPPPYSDDPIMRLYKFTNVYRSLDRVSQYMIKNVIYNGKKYSAKSMFWRIIIFKHFNLGSTWDHITTQIGDIDEFTELDSISDCLNNFQRMGGRLYSNAYMMASSFMGNAEVRKKFGFDRNVSKHKAYFQIFKRAIIDIGLDEKIIGASSLEEVYNYMHSVFAFGEFTAYQMTVDLNYSTIFDFSENDFAAIGPGTKRGMDRTFSHSSKKLDYLGVIQYVRDNLEQLLLEHKLLERFKPLPGRWPTKTDLLNCFCETDKYLRGAALNTEGKNVYGKRVKNKFRPNLVNKINYVFPPKWGIKL